MKTFKYQIGFKRSLRLLIWIIALASSGFFFYVLKAKSSRSEILVWITQNKIQFPSSLISKPGSPLLIALQSYLGTGITIDKESNSTLLKSGGEGLIKIEDSEGIQHISHSIDIAWDIYPLLKTKIIRRKVLGPFASFESANRSAVQLKQNGVLAFVAYPKDWEVWVPIKEQLPDGFKAAIVSKRITNEIRPVLRDLGNSLPLTGPIKIDAPDGLLWNGGIYFGSFYLKPDAYGTWTLIQEIPLENYLLGVVPHEIGSDSPKAALEAQTILARTWALANDHRFSLDGYHLCTNTQCQVYRDPNKASVKVRSAIKQTRGIFLDWNGEPIHAVYHASNGGVSASVSEAWSVKSLPYLKPNIDGSLMWRSRHSLPLRTNSKVQYLLSMKDGAYGNNHRLFRWKRDFTIDDLEIIFDESSYKNFTPDSISVTERGPSGRVINLEFYDSINDLKVVLKRDEIRRKLRKLPSTLFVVERLSKGKWQFDGGGFGHGVGLSQAGAIDLANRGWSSSKILEYYYPGTNYGTLP
tara:strand:- start:57 stop:1628 length:1572 start_codon:yes stop_codon:yes gene_type:complete